MFYYHSLIVRWIAGVGKGASVSVQGLLIVALSAGKDLAYAGGILRYAQNDRAGHYQVLDLDGQLKDPVSVAGMGFCGFDHYGKGPRGSTHGGPVVLGFGAKGGRWRRARGRCSGVDPVGAHACTPQRGGPLGRPDRGPADSQGRGPAGGSRKRGEPSPRTGQRLVGRNRRPRPGPPSLPGGFATGRAPRRRWGTRGHRR